MRDIHFCIARNIEGRSFTQDYRLTYQPGQTIVWWLTKIQEEIDATLAFPVSCRAGLCGGCGLMVNGRSVLACETMLDNCQRDAGDEITIGPLQNFPVSKDLVIDWSQARARMKQLIPWNPSEPSIDIHAEIRLTPDVCSSLLNLGSCITCGLCVSECPAMKSGLFIEPYLFIKCRQILVDSRISEENKDRVVSNIKPFASHCIQCGKCKAVCPRGLSPEDATHFSTNHLPSSQNR